MFDSFKPTESLTPDDGNLVFDSTGGGGRSTVLLPYIEQHGGEANDGGIVINWTTGDGPKGWDSVGVIAIITPTEHGGSVLEFSVENVPNNSSQSGPGDERLAGFCATGQTSGDGSNQGIVIDWTSGDGSSHDAFPTETIFPTETVRPMESVNPGGWICDVTYEQAALAHEGEADDGGIIINWTSGDGSSHQEGDAFPTETIRPMESVHALYDLVV
jgi:hypothetical protein